MRRPLSQRHVYIYSHASKGNLDMNQSSFETRIIRETIVSRFDGDFSYEYKGAGVSDALGGTFASRRGPKL